MVYLSDQRKISEGDILTAVVPCSTRTFVVIMTVKSVRETCLQHGSAGPLVCLCYDAGNCSAHLPSNFHGK